MIAKIVGVSLLAAIAAAAPPSTGALRRHRLIMPTPPLPHNLTVDEREWSITPSEGVVAAGTVRLQVYDRGEDAHNLTIQGPVTASGDGRIRGQVWLKSGGTATMVAQLRPGTYKLYCSMFMGTPQSHEMLGMLSRITVR